MDVSTVSIPCRPVRGGGRIEGCGFRIARCFERDPPTAWSVRWVHDAPRCPELARRGSHQARKQTPSCQARISSHQGEPSPACGAVVPRVGLPVQRQTGLPVTKACLRERASRQTGLGCEGLP